MYDTEATGYRYMIPDGAGYRYVLQMVLITDM